MALLSSHSGHSGIYEWQGGLLGFCHSVTLTNRHGDIVTLVTLTKGDKG